jgi:hypothetical protein
VHVAGAHGGILEKTGKPGSIPGRLDEPIAGVFEKEFSVVLGENSPERAVCEQTRFAFQIGPVPEQSDKAESQSSEEHEEAETDRDRFGSAHGLFLPLREKVLIPSKRCFSKSFCSIFSWCTP